MMTDRSSVMITKKGTELRKTKEEINSYFNDKAVGHPPIIPPIIWNDDDRTEFEKLLKVASKANIRVAIRFRELTTDLIAQIVFKYRCVYPIVVSTFSLTPDKGLVIGNDWPDKISGYDERRLHSLILPSEHRFVESLRDVIFAMRGEKKTVDLPWNPYGQEVVGVTTTGVSKSKPKFTKPPSLAQLYEVFGGTFDPQPSISDELSAATELLKNANDVTMRRHIEEAEWHGRRVHLLVTGESGTGKSLVARLAHEVLYADCDASKRPFERVNCGARSESNLEFELFGATSGKYTDVSAGVGTLARASYGTAFLDEFGDMPRSCQPMFLTYLDDLMIRPKGEIRPFFSFTYVVAATNRDLPSLIRATEFRNDLFQRFARRVRIPSLRERSRKEILELIDMAAQHPDENPIEEVRKDETRRRIKSIAPDATELLTSHEYSDGNIRELESIVHQALQTARRRNSDIIERGDLDIPDYPSFRPDSERNVVRVKAFPAFEASVMLNDHRDLDKISERSGRPILKSRDAYGVILDSILYECPIS